MSRHNFLLQVATQPKSSALCNPVWADMYTSNGPKNNRGYDAEPMPGRGRGSQDKFGNDGYATIEEAHKDLEHFTKVAGGRKLYRIVQVVA